LANILKGKFSRFYFILKTKKIVLSNLED